MLKLMILGRRAPGTTRAQAQHHLKHVHGRLVLLPPADAGAMPRDYVQNHVVDGVYPAHGGHAIERDLFTEIWFDDMPSLQASTSTPYYLAKLKPDEPRFVDDATVVKMLVRPTTLSEGRKGAFKLFILIGLSAAGLGQSDTISDLISAHLRDRRHTGALVCNTVLPSPSGQPAFVQLVFEVWFADMADAYATLEGARVLLAKLPEQVVDQARCLALLAEEFTSARLKQLFENNQVAL